MSRTFSVKPVLVAAFCMPLVSVPPVMAIGYGGGMSLSPHIDSHISFAQYALVDESMEGAEVEGMVLLRRKTGLSEEYDDLSYEFPEDSVFYEKNSPNGIETYVSEELLTSAKPPIHKHDIQDIRLAKYLSEQAEKTKVSVTANLAWKVWKMLASSYQGGAMPVPGAGFGEEGQVLLTWDSGIHHFDVEIYGDNNIEFFYRNRDTGDIWGEDWVYKASAKLPSEALRKANLIK